MQVFRSITQGTFLAAVTLILFTANAHAICSFKRNTEYTTGAEIVRGTVIKDVIYPSGSSYIPNSYPCPIKSESLTLRTDQNKFYYGTRYFGLDTKDIPYGEYTLTASVTYTETLSDGSTREGYSDFYSKVKLVDDSEPEVTLSLIPATPSYHVSGVIQIYAQAYDPSGIKEVQFYSYGGGKSDHLIHTDTTAPYSVQINTNELWEDYGYRITVKAIDYSGNVSDGTARSFKVNNDNQAPTINLVDPDNTTVSGEVTVKATVNDAEALDRIIFYVDENVATTLTNVTKGTRSAKIDTTLYGDGVHTITAVVIDVNGAAARDSYYLQFDNLESKPPVVYFTSHKQGDVIKGTETITANAYDDESGIAQVTFNLDGLYLGVATKAPYSIPFDSTRFPNGVYKLTATAHDNASNKSQASLFISTNNKEDTFESLLSILKPSDGNIIRGRFEIAAIAFDNIAVKEVQFFLNDELIGKRTALPYAMNYDSTQKSDGQYTLKVRSLDYTGNSSEESIQLIFDNTGATDEILPDNEIIEDPETGYIEENTEQPSEQGNEVSDNLASLSVGIKSQLTTLSSVATEGEDARSERLIAIKEMLKDFMVLIREHRTELRSDPETRKIPSTARRVRKKVRKAIQTKRKARFKRLTRRSIRLITRFLKLM